MRKRFYTFILFLKAIGLCIAQTSYNFDIEFFFKDSQKSSGTYIINSDNPNYFIYIYEKRGTLYDYENNIVREFEYLETSNKKIFRFTSHEKFSPKDEFSINNILVEKVSENKYSISCFSKQNSIKPNLKLIVSLKPSNKDLIHFYLLDINYNIHKKIIESLKEKLEGNHNYIIDNYIVYYGKRNKHHHFLEKLNEIKLEIAPSKN